VQLMPPIQCDPGTSQTGSSPGTTCSLRLIRLRTARSLELARLLQGGLCAQNRISRARSRIKPIHRRRGNPQAWYSYGILLSVDWLHPQMTSRAIAINAANPFLITKPTTEGAKTMDEFCKTAASKKQYKNTVYMM
jgi:hypothetical protein